MSKDSDYFGIPKVFKKDKATIILLIDGLADMFIGILYFFFLRYKLILLTEPIQKSGIVNFNIILIFDIVIFLEFIIAIFELIAVYHIKFTKNEQIPKIIKRIFVISHVILIPLGGLIGLIVDLIFM
ncbi:MAG: hypothetical protein ACTSQG_04010 [Promethearchaeota archaeon]